MTRLWKLRLRRLAFALGSVIAGFTVTLPAMAQAIWFSPNPRVGNGSDYLDLFRPDAPWQRAASHVQMFEMSGHSIMGAPQANFVPEADLLQIFSDLKRRHIGLGIGVEPLTAPRGSSGPTNCAYHVESYGGPPPLWVAQRAKTLGAEPQIFGMDEPLYFGHVFRSPDGKHGCRSSIADIAHDVADKVRQVRTVFPGIRFGDVEPLTFDPKDPWYRNGTWLADLSNWFDAYQAAVGDRLAFFRLDLWWDTPWPQYMPALTALLARKGIPLQVIYDGNGQDRTDASWVASAVAHVKKFESGHWPKPAVAAFEFWMPNPTHNLPESNPLTTTGLIDRYVQWQQTGH